MTEWAQTKKGREYHRAYHKIYNHTEHRAAYKEAYRLKHQKRLHEMRVKREVESASLYGMTVWVWLRLRTEARDDAKKLGVDKLALYRQRNLLSITERKRETRNA